MRNKIYILLTSFLLVAVLTGCSKSVDLTSSNKPLSIAQTTASNESNAKLSPVEAKTPSENVIHKSPEHSQEELYQDIFVTLLDPYIQETIKDYYKQSLNISPVSSPANVEILSVERPIGYRSFLFVIELQVKPYVGPHIGVGVDKLTIRMGTGGEVKVEKFEHIETYQLPPQYQNIKKS